MKLITDDLKQEGKIYRNLMIIAYALAIIYPMGGFASNAIVGNNGFETRDLVICSIFLFAFGSVELFCWIITMRYRLTVKEDAFIIRVLSGQKEIPVKNVVGFSHKTAKKLCYFRLYTNEGYHLVVTRYANELLEFLNEKGIGQKES